MRGSSEGEIRFRLDLHYDGSGFYGWQIQPRRRTVQGVLEEAVAEVARVERTVTGSGRTDRGVHATGQVASVELPPKWTSGELCRALNAVLPDDVWVERVRRVEPGFHPRYDAVARTYEYRVGTRPEAWSPFHRPFCWPVDDPLDRALLERGARMIPGERSFAAFAKAGQPERGTRCRVDRAAWAPWSGPGLRFAITADRYLHHMVRYLVGTMVDVARGRRAVEDLDALLNDPETERWTSPPAPPHGLFLTRVEYAPGPEEADAVGARRAERAPEA